ncbi:MAG: glycoside hydrolase family 9 protein [Bacteroidota bacterium]
MTHVFTGTRRLSVVLALLSILAAPLVAQPTVNPYIVVDQFGYLPDAAKVAVIVDPQLGHNAAESFEPGTAYELRRWSDGAVVYTGDLVAWDNGATDAQSGDRGWWFDFSTVEEAGSYYVYDLARGVRSHRFEIGIGIYGAVLREAVRTYFYQRVNFAKEEPYADPRWTDGAAFEGASQDRAARYVRDRNNAALARDLHGGWFDAGDYNKYVTFAFSAVQPLLAAYRRSPEAFTDDFGLPESGNGLPDLIDELLYEFDWLKRMQDTDGGVFIKMGDLNYDNPPPPSSDRGPRYYEQKCSSSTIAAAAMFAHGALVFGEFAELENYAEDLESRAERAWTWYQDNPRSTECDPQTIKAGDADQSLQWQDGTEVVAAAYLFAQTGRASYEDVVKASYTATRPWNDNTFARYNLPQGDALLFYAELPAADEPTQTAILDHLTDQTRWSHAYKDNTASLYRAYMPDAQYHWGSNMVVAAYGATNMMVVEAQVDPANDRAYRDRALGYLQYLHGVNPHQRVYLSNMYAYGAEKSVDEMYHSWFNDRTPWDNVANGPGPAPGYLVGGPNKAYGGSALPSQSGACAYPPMKCYADTNNSGTSPWELTEPAIYYQANYIRLLAHFASGASTATGTAAPADLPHGFVLEAPYPNPFNPHTQVTLTLATTQDIDLAVYDLLGRRIQTLHRGPLHAGARHRFTFDAQGLPSGLYLIRATGPTTSLHHPALLQK